MGLVRDLKDSLVQDLKDAAFVFTPSFYPNLWEDLQKLEERNCKEEEPPAVYSAPLKKKILKNLREFIRFLPEVPTILRYLREEIYRTGRDFRTLSSKRHDFNRRTKN